MSSDKLTITKNADGGYAGKWEGMRGESKISNMKFEGGKLAFIRTMDFRGQIMEQEFEGTVEGESIKGVFKGDRGGNREVTAKRVAAAKAELPKAEPNEPAPPPAPKKPEAPKPK